jgi:hypothetical protein
VTCLRGVVSRQRSRSSGCGGRYSRQRGVAAAAHSELPAEPRWASGEGKGEMPTYSHGHPVTGEGQFMQSHPPLSE